MSGTYICDCLGNVGEFRNVLSVIFFVLRLIISAMFVLYQIYRRLQQLFRLCAAVSANVLALFAHV